MLVSALLLISHLHAISWPLKNMSCHERQLGARGGTDLVRLDAICTRVFVRVCLGARVCARVRVCVRVHCAGVCVSVHVCLCVGVCDLLSSVFII